jgi:hypothetical protein
MPSLKEQPQEIGILFNTSYKKTYIFSDICDVAEFLFQQHSSLQETFFIPFRDTICQKKKFRYLMNLKLCNVSVYFFVLNYFFFNRVSVQFEVSKYVWTSVEWKNLSVSEAQFIVPDWVDKVDFWHRVVVPGRQAT